jgi:hypothetical protein
MATIFLTAGATNHAHLLVTDQFGHRLGYVNGQLVNEIPGASFVQLASDHVWQQKLEPVLFVPATVAYTFTLDGSTLTAPDDESVTIIGPKWHVAINHIPMRPGDKDIVTADPNTTRLTYHTTRDSAPTIEASTTTSRAHYEFVITGVSNTPGSTLNLHVPAGSGTMVIDDVGSTGTSSVTFEMTRYTQQGLQHFRHTAIPLAGADTIAIEFRHWTDPSQGIPLVTTHDGHQSTEVLTNQ